MAEETSSGSICPLTTNALVILPSVEPMIETIKYVCACVCVSETVCVHIILGSIVVHVC